MATTSPEEYESAQNFNFITKWFHSFRYNALYNFFDQLEKDNPEKTITILEIGAAYGKLYSLLNERYDISYYGIELHKPLYDIANARYGSNLNATFILGNCLNQEVWNGTPEVDIVISLETLEHIPEHDVVRLIEKISKKNPKHFICSVPVEVGPAIWMKNVGSFLMGYMRHKEYTWKETFWAGLYSLDKVGLHYTGHKGFDWRWLAQTIRHNFKILKKTTFPFSFIPSAFATSVFFISAPLNSNVKGDKLK